MKKQLIGILVALALLAGGGWYFTRDQGGSSPEVRFETVKVQRGRLVAKVTASGTLSALVTVQVGSQVSGRIQALYADFNSVVKKGQELARIDPQLFQAALEQTQANLLTAEGNLTKARVQTLEAKRQLERTRTLAERKLVAQADLDTAQATYESAEAQIQVAKGSVAQARAALNQARVNLAYTTIISPIDGMVISRNVDVGQTVAASLQAPTLFTIAEDLRKMQVDTNVAEADVGRLSDGMTATFTVDAWPGERFKGRVRQIRNSPQTLQNVVTYDAVIDVANPDLKLRPGMTANVSLVYAERESVLKVPSAALRFRPDPSLLGEGKGGAGTGGAQARGGEKGIGAKGTGERGAGVARGAEGGPGSGQGRGERAGRGEGAGGPEGEAVKPGTSRRKVYRLVDGKLEALEVLLGVSDGSATELLSTELKEGDELVTEAITRRSGASPMGLGAPMPGPRRGL